jgi:putative ATP-dependent endonuclease of the OLD family
MLLRRISIENFRGIRLAVLDLDPTTAIIGENGAGKSTFLDALSVCLTGHDDVVRLELRDFHQDENGSTSPSLRMELVFQGSEAEWQLPQWERFAPFVDKNARTAGDLCLEVRATRDAATDAVNAQWTFGSNHTTDVTSHAGLLAEWRRRSPVIRLRANRYIEHSPRGTASLPHEPDPAGGSGGDPVTWQIERQIRLAYDQLGGGADLAPQEARRALEAVEAYLGAPGRPMIGQVVLPPRLAGDLAETPIRSGRRPALEGIKQGAGMRGLALVALVGAIIEARRHGALADDAHPIVLLEDAEAHLHPIALSAMWELIASLPAQKVITTNSGELLARLPLRSIRRLVVERGLTRVCRTRSESYSVEDLRRIAYHVRINRAAALFARCWILVEGETEAWVLPELAQICGYDLAAEGVRCVEFAQSGIGPLVHLAADLGIEWHLLADGDLAGRSYVATARKFLSGRALSQRITALDEPDLEHCLFEHGFAPVYCKEAGGAIPAFRHSRAGERTRSIITRAVKKRSKPGMALAVLEAANSPDGPRVPAPLRGLIETAVRLARGLMEPTPPSVSRNAPSAARRHDARG